MILPPNDPIKMKLKVDELAKTILSANQRVIFRQKPMFRKYKTISSDDLSNLERKIAISIPHDLRDWLLLVGYGDINDEISFHEEWFTAITSGQLKGGVIFAQDILGNFYSFDLQGRIYYLSRSRPVFANVSDDFSKFISELIRHNYKLIDWVKTLKVQNYDW